MSQAGLSVDEVHCCYIDGENLQVIYDERSQNHNRSIETDIL